MGIRKWLMKQQWRLTQIRGIWTLFYGILVLAYAYYVYIPVFSELGMIGPFAFGATVFVIFLLLGYIYDRVLLMWAPAIEVGVERNPYQYVPAPQHRVFWLPLYSAMLDSIEALATELGADTSVVQETRQYYAKLQKLRVENAKDIDKAIALREAFLREHPFGKMADQD